MTHNLNNTSDKPPRQRLILGGMVFISGFLSPLLIPVVLASDLAPGWKTTISGALAIGIPELFMIIAAGILGKSGFAYLKQKLLALLKKHGPPDEVSLVRYRIGLIMFCLPVITGLILPYFEHYLPDYESYSFWIKIGGDIMLFMSLFLLGGDFWDKLRSLFIHKSRAVLISDMPKTNDHA
jgi:hypothetical protein